MDWNLGWKDLFLASPAVEHYFIYCSLFRLNNVKVLWKDTGNREEKGETILVVFMEFIQDVLLLRHNMLAARHQIIKHTKPILREWSFLVQGDASFVSIGGPSKRNQVLYRRIHGESAP